MSVPCNVVHYNIKLIVPRTGCSVASAAAAQAQLRGRGALPLPPTAARQPAGRRWHSPSARRLQGPAKRSMPTPARSRNSGAAGPGLAQAAGAPGDVTGRAAAQRQRAHRKVSSGLATPRSEPR